MESSFAVSVPVISDKQFCRNPLRSLMASTHLTLSRKCADFGVNQRFKAQIVQYEFKL